MSTMTRAASTDSQERAITKVEAWAKANDIQLSFGTTIGKHPQTVILDEKFQDGAVYIDADGAITIQGEDVDGEFSFVELMRNRLP